MRKVFVINWQMYSTHFSRFIFDIFVYKRPTFTLLTFFEPIDKVFDKLLSEISISMTFNNEMCVFGMFVREQLMLMAVLSL